LHFLSLPRFFIRGEGNSPARSPVIDLQRRIRHSDYRFEPMDIRDLHCIVIGAGIGGLTAAAMLSRKGMQVTVLEAGKHPGGCAGSFPSRGLLFDAGATVGCGFHPGGPLELLGRELGIDWPVAPEPIAWQYRHRDLRLDLQRSREAVVARFPRSAPFWKEQSQLAGMLWRLSDEGLPWPQPSPGDLLRMTRKGVAGFPGTARLLQFVSKSAHDWLSSHGLDRDPDFTRFIDAQLLISVQALSRDANALNAAIALDLPASGTWRVRGGIGRVAELLAGSVEGDGGAVMFGKRVIRIDSIRREVIGVETEDGDALAADLLIANLTPDSLAALEGRPPGTDSTACRPEWSAFMLYLGMDSSAFDQAGATHLQLLAPEGGFAEGRSLFVSASPVDDPSRAPEGVRAVTVSTHTRPELWPENHPGRGEAYLEMKELYTERVLQLMREAMPESEGAVRSVLAATPFTWERWTGRRGGYVGGYAQSSLFGVRGPATAYDNLFLVGDSIFPGQSLPGVVVGARRTVELVLRQARKIRR
jgi:C-3',4' desaturase CrtD